GRTASTQATLPCCFLLLLLAHPPAGGGHGGTRYRSTWVLGSNGSNMCCTAYLVLSSHHSHDAPAERGRHDWSIATQARPSPFLQALSLFSPSVSTVIAAKGTFSVDLCVYSCCSQARRSSWWIFPVLVRKVTEAM